MSNLYISNENNNLYFSTIANFRFKGDINKITINLNDGLKLYNIETLNKTSTLNINSNITEMHNTTVINKALIIHSNLENAEDGSVYTESLASKINNIYINNKKLIPDNIIMIWPWPENIPSGWLLCDGNLGTPDLKNKFIYGFSQNDNTINTTLKGGAPSIKLEEKHIPYHAHNYKGTTQTETIVEDSCSTGKLLENKMQSSNCKIKTSKEHLHRLSLRYEDGAAYNTRQAVYYKPNSMIEIGDDGYGSIYQSGSGPSFGDAFLKGFTFQVTVGTPRRAANWLYTKSIDLGLTKTSDTVYNLAESVARTQHSGEDLQEDAHTHRIEADTAQTFGTNDLGEAEEQSIMPPYIVLCYIIKKSV